MLGLIIFKYGRNQINEKETQEIVDAFRNIDFPNTVAENEINQNGIVEGEITNTEKAMPLEYKGYKVIGIVNIDKIGIEYPILEIENIDPETAKVPLQYSIIKYWGNDVNDYGNLSIAGHNYIYGTMYGKIKKL